MEYTTEARRPLSKNLNLSIHMRVKPHYEQCHTASEIQINIHAEISSERQHVD
jgi:hypothetical protein